MSSWVVPSVAAEIWNVAVETILSQIKSGQLPTRQEAGFLFVDIDPSPTLAAPSKPLSPLTYTTVTPAEIAALGESPDLSQWRLVRQSTSRVRRAPAIAA
jgi:hypothetical protein